MTEVVLVVAAVIVAAVLACGGMLWLLIGLPLQAADRAARSGRPVLMPPDDGPEDW